MTVFSPFVFPISYTLIEEREKKRKEKGKTVKHKQKIVSLRTCGTQKDRDTEMKGTSNSVFAASGKGVK